MVVVTGLYQPNPLKSALASTDQHILHQLPADTSGLSIGVDRDGPDPRYLRTFVKKVAPDNSTIKLSYSRIEIGMRYKKSHQPGCNIWRRKVWRKIVPLGDAFEGFKTDPPALRRVGWYTATQFQIHVLFAPVIRAAMIAAAQSRFRLIQTSSSKFPSLRTCPKAQGVPGQKKVETGLATAHGILADVRFGSKADMCGALAHVR